ncbi:TonB-dependent receptor [soil metagenome]
MKYFFILICFLILFFQGVAQRNTRYMVSGTITEITNGQPLAGVSIYVPDVKIGTFSGATGHYSLSVSPGTYTFSIGHVGFKNIVTTIHVNQNVTADFALDISVTEENEIVVTGSSKATSLRKNPIPIVSINKQYLQQNLSTNIIDAISRVPGISAVTTGPNISKPFIRGLGFNRILTLYDGVRQEGQQWGDEHGIEIDQNNIDKVEVVKGPASLIYGSDAVAGVINFLPPNPPGEGKIMGNFSNEYQSNNRLISNSVSVGGNKNSLFWNGTLSHKIATNFKNKVDKRVYNTGFEETDGQLLLGVNRQWGYTHIGLSLFNNLQEVPDGSRDSASRKFTKQITEGDTYRPIVSDEELTSYKISDIHQHVQHYRLYTADNFIVGRDRIGINLAYQKSIRKEFSHPEATTTPGLELLLNTFSYDAKYFFSEKNGWSFTSGVNGMYQKNNSEKGTEFVIPSYQQFEAGPFLYAKKSIKNVEVAGGLRYDIRNFKNDVLYINTDPVTGFEIPVYGPDTIGARHAFRAFSKIFSGVSGSAGISYRISKQLNLKVNIGRGFRAPNISEISANGVHPGTNIYQLGNVNFKPEFNLQEDIGINYNNIHVTINAELFNNNITNYIFNQKLSNAAGQDSIIIPGNQTFQFQQGRAQLYGGEFTIDIHPHPWDWLHFENSLSVVYGRNKGVSGIKISDSARYLPFIAPLHTFSELRANVKKISSALSNAFTKIQLEHYATQNRVYLENGTETPTAGYTLTNASLGADITGKKGQPIFTFSLFANNIFDVAYQSHLNRLKYFEPYPNDPRPFKGIYNMGRNFGIKINVPLNFSSK